MNDNPRDSVEVDERADSEENPQKSPTDDDPQNDSYPSAAQEYGDRLESDSRVSNGPPASKGNTPSVVPPLVGLPTTDRTVDMEKEGVKLPTYHLDDLFEWERMKCETPYYLQGENVTGTSCFCSANASSSQLIHD